VEVILSVFAGIFNEEGKLLLRRRRKESREIPCPYEGDWELPGGTIEEENIWKIKDERIFGKELAREVMEETGLSIETPVMPILYPAVYVNKEKGKIDCAFLIPIGIIAEEPTKGENIYVDPKELKERAERPIGEQLVSGWGKRMCRMALMAFQYSPNSKYKNDAKKLLAEIYQISSQ
jgi:ADP-ribose pyrophosphatase YjhB (NUDIX family)